MYVPPGSVIGNRDLFTEDIPLGHVLIVRKAEFLQAIWFYLNAMNDIAVKLQMYVR